MKMFLILFEVLVGLVVGVLGVVDEVVFVEFGRVLFLGFLVVGLVLDLVVVLVVEFWCVMLCFL